jgi:hypothetical protein
MFVIHTPLHSPFYAAHICLLSLQEQPLLPPTCQAVDYCQWPVEACPPDRLKWRQQQQSRVPDLPSVFAPPGFMIERISLRPVGYGAQIKIILFVLLPAA